MHNISRWFVPSMYGDVNVKQVSPKVCSVEWEKLTVSEKHALITLEEHARKKGWIGRTDRMDDFSKKGEIRLEAPLEKVSKMLAKLLKPGRKLVSAVRFSDGKMQEIIEADYVERDEAGREIKGRRAEEGKLLSMKPKVESDPPAPEAIAATVAKPYVGCPAPDFENAEIRARYVLEQFLTEEQLADFRKYNRFVSLGATTGHRYVVSSRHSKSSMDQFHRSLYDLDERRALCVHDWNVPAAEEMLMLHVLVSLPGYEDYVRFLPADGLGIA